MRTTRRLASLLAALAVLYAGPATAETVNCTAITAVPAVITVPGVYCFTKSLVTSIASGIAISIQANNVVLDMNGHRLGGLAAGLGTTAVGIHATNRQNITIRNGTIRGFLYGIELQNGASQGHLIEDMRADQNTYVGIWVEGTGSIIRNNQIVATGGTTAFGANSLVFGIYVTGNGVRAINNDVITMTRSGADPSVGIQVASGVGNLLDNNRMTGADNGIVFAGGTGKYRNNLTFDVTTPYTGGTNAGNNN